MIIMSKKKCISGAPVKPLQYRHINGKSFLLQSRHKKKINAKKRADKWRDCGYNARVIKKGKFWGIWLR